MGNLILQDFVHGLKGEEVNGLQRLVVEFLVFVGFPTTLVDHLSQAFLGHKLVGNFVIFDVRLEVLKRISKEHVSHYLVRFIGQLVEELSYVFRLFRNVPYSSRCHRLVEPVLEILKKEGESDFSTLKPLRKETPILHVRIEPSMKNTREEDAKADFHIGDLAHE